MIAGFIGKMGCLVEGTLVQTVDGLVPIENVDSVLSFDGEHVVSVPCGVVRTEKVPYEITFSDGSVVVASDEHEWFVSKTATHSTKTLKKGECILSLNEEPIRLEKSYVARTPRERDSQGLRSWDEYNESRQEIRSVTNSNHEQDSSSRSDDKALEGTISNRDGEGLVQEDEGRAGEASIWKEQPCISSRKNGRSEEESCRILVDSETGSQVGMLYLPTEEYEQELRFNSASQGWQQQEQLSREFGCFVPIVSFQCSFGNKNITGIKRLSDSPVVMYDLVVPNTNNFFLANGVLTHNSGKTLSMTKELLKYHNQGYRILSNYGLTIPHEPIDFDQLFLSAQNQEQLNNVVIALDEIHIVLDSRSGMAATNKVISFWLNQTRKMNVKLFYTTQHAHQIDKRLRSATDFYVMCDGFKITKAGKTYFVCYNEITDGDYYKKDLFIGNEFFDYYDTNQVIKFIDRKALKKKAKEAK